MTLHSPPWLRCRQGGLVSHSEGALSLPSLLHEAHRKKEAFHASVQLSYYPVLFEACN